MSEREHVVVSDKVQRAVDAMSRYLVELGVDLRDERLSETPRRIVEGHLEMLSGYSCEASSLVGETIPGDHDGMVVVGDIAFASLCEHHLLPFFGSVDLAYLPNPQGRVVGLSKVARLVEVLSQRLQVQERMTTEIVHAMDDGFSPRGVLVVVRAEHLCVTARGVKSRGSTVTTTFASGALRGDGAQAHEARMLIHGQHR